MRRPNDLPIQRHTDEELVERTKDGDPSAFAALVERHRKTALRTAFGILRNREDAEDEVQNALWKAFEHIGDFEGGCRFNTWLTRIVVNQCLMRIRQSRRAVLVPIDQPVRSDETTSTRELPDHSNPPDHDLARREICRVVQLEVRRIPPLLREALVLRHLHDLSISEVAVKLGISAAAAKSRLLRGRAELETRLRKHQGRLGAATLVA